jgi:hypothetical protein
MASARTLECMSELYQGEMLGEFLLEGLLLKFGDEPGARRVIGAALQYETETKARLRPAIMRLGLPLTTPDQVRTDAEAQVAAFATLTWPEFLAAGTADLQSRVVPRYHEIARIAADDGDPVAVEVADYMVIHETALLEMLEKALNGEANPTRGVDALLHFPLPIQA